MSLSLTLDLSGTFCTSAALEVFSQTRTIGVGVSPKWVCPRSQRLPFLRSLLRRYAVSLSLSLSKAAAAPMHVATGHKEMRISEAEVEPEEPTARGKWS